MRCRVVPADVDGFDAEVLVNTQASRSAALRTADRPHAVTSFLTNIHETQDSKLLPGPASERCCWT